MVNEAHTSSHFFHALTLKTRQSYQDLQLFTYIHWICELCILANVPASLKALPNWICLNLCVSFTVTEDFQSHASQQLACFCLLPMIDKFIQALSTLTLISEGLVCIVCYITRNFWPQGKDLRDFKAFPFPHPHPLDLVIKKKQNKT